MKNYFPVLIPMYWQYAEHAKAGTDTGNMERVHVPELAQ